MVTRATEAWIYGLECGFSVPYGILTIYFTRSREGKKSPLKTIS